MAIVSAAVEDNGWVLALVFAGSAGGFADYVMDPDGLPRVLVRSSHPGFIQSGGAATSGTMARAIPATIPLRLPVNPSAPSPAVIDEEDIGGGLRRVRLALANFVYATDTGLTLDVLANWRDGEGGAVGIPVTNNSTVVAPLPIFRWTDLQFQVEQGVFQVGLIVASHHPVGFAPVAGVKFTATDGTTTKEVWATSLSTDTRYGDDLRCYMVTFDPGAGTPFTPGLLRIDAEVYPWLGAMRSTDPAGTRVMDEVRVAARSSSAITPFTVLYDPDGDRYSGQWVYVDPVNGTTTASAAMVQPTLADAKAVAPASRPQTVSTALQALWLTNRTMAAANGQGGPTARACDGARIVLAPGVSVIAGTTVSSGLQAYEAPVRIIGDPDDADPRNNCILRSAASQPAAMRISRIQFENCTLEIGQSTLLNGTLLHVTKNVTVRGKAGFETSTSGLTANSLTAGTTSINCLNTLWWRTGLTMDTTQLRFGLIRNCQHSRVARGHTLLKNRWVQPDDDTVGAGNVAGTFNVAADLAGCEDNFIAYNDYRRARTRALLFTTPSAATAGTAFASQRRQVIMGNVLELIDPAGTQPLFSIGENQSVTASYNIIEGNSFAGERVNIWYNYPPIGTNN